MKNMLRYILAPIAGCLVGMLFLRFISDNIDIGDCMYMFICAINRGMPCNLFKSLQRKEKEKLLSRKYLFYEEKNTK